MVRVVVEGSPTPCVEVPRGVRREVEYTDSVQKKIDKGYLTVVRFIEDEPKPPPPFQPRRRARLQTNVQTVPEGGGGGGGSADSGDTDTERVAAEGATVGGALHASGETSG